MRKYDLVIFDMDGTVLDTLDDLTDAVNETLRVFGMPTHEKEAICRFVGNGPHKLIERAVKKGTDKETISRVFDAYVAYYATHSAEKTRPFNGVADLLHALRTRGVKTAVLSNKQDSAVISLAKRYFGDLFDLARGQIEGVPVKPAPDGVFEICRTLCVPLSRTAYVGDSEVDVATAAASGVDGIFVSYGFRSAEALFAAGAREVCPDVAALAAKLNENELSPF